MATVQIQCDVSLETYNGEAKTNLLFDTRVFAKDLTPVSHDVVGYEGFVYVSAAAQAAGEEPVRVKNFHPTLEQTRGGARFRFQGQILSTDLASYATEVVAKKVELTAASQVEVVTKIIESFAASLGVQTTDFTIL